MVVVFLSSQADMEASIREKRFDDELDVSQGFVWSVSLLLLLVGGAALCVLSSSLIPLVAGFSCWLKM